MIQDGFQLYLETLGMESDEIVAVTKSVTDFEDWLDISDWSDSRFEITESVIIDYSKNCISRELNTWEHYLALARYARYLKHDQATRWFIELLDGSEVMENLSKKVKLVLGSDLHQSIFGDLNLPVIGTPNREKSVFTQVVMERLERLCSKESCCSLLEDCLRDLSDKPHLKARRQFHECNNLDEYLQIRGKEYIVELEYLQENGQLYYTQPVTDEMLTFLRCNPEILHGVRQGDILYKVKIPYLTAEYLKETDPLRKRYLYCHCPWARESILQDEVNISSTFCNCSGGFMKKPWEVIFGQPLHAEMVQSVLAGDDCCRVAIHLPTYLHHP
jgi:hypothetical protein